MSEFEGVIVLILMVAFLIALGALLYDGGRRR